MNQSAKEMLWSKSPRLAVVASVTTDRFAILHLDASQPVVLTGTGASIWEALDQADSVSTVSALLSDLYEVEPAIIRSQVYEFFGQLAAQSLIIPKEE